VDHPPWNIFHGDRPVKATRKKRALNSDSLSAGTQQPSTGRRLLIGLGWTILGLLLLLLLLVATGAGYQAWATARDRRAYPPPGQLVDVGGYQLHLLCQGEGSPTVVLDALGDGTSVYWTWVQPIVAQQTRVCAYDRAGRGWSEPGPLPRDTAQIAKELHTLLVNGGETGPYVLVGHSFGALVARVFAAAYGDEVAGVVLVDGGNPAIRSDRFPAEGLARMDEEITFMQMAPWLARLGVFRFAGNPPPLLPPTQQEMAAAHYGSTALWASLLAEAQGLAQSDAQAEAAGSLGDRPLGIVLATEAWLTPDAPADEARRVYNALQSELAALSTNSRVWLVEGADHASLVTNQAHAEQTAQAIGAVVEAARTGEPLGE
jgi:pimeloyl-ACP methyl ester carboxylesterase